MNRMTLKIEMFSKN